MLEAKFGRSYGADALYALAGLLSGGNPYHKILKDTGYGGRELAAKNDIEFANKFSHLTGNNYEHLLKAAEVAASLQSKELANIFVDLTASVALENYQFDTSSQRLSIESKVSARTWPYLHLFSTALTLGYLLAFGLLQRRIDLHLDERIEVFKLALNCRHFDDATINQLFLDGENDKSFIIVITGTDLVAQLTIITFTVTNQRYEVFKKLIKTYALAGKRYSHLTDASLNGHAVSLFEQVLKNGLNWPKSTGRMLREIAKVFHDMPYDNVTTAARMLHDLEKYSDFADVMAEINEICTARFYENQRKGRKSLQFSDDKSNNANDYDDDDDDVRIKFEDLRIENYKDNNGKK